MPTSAVLDAVHVQLDAGEHVAVPLTVRNESRVVEAYTFEVLGPAASWARVDPPEVSIYPGASATAAVVFEPPRDAQVPAGEFAYAVRVVPHEHPEDSVVPEGVVEVLPFLSTTAELVPRTTRGRRGAPFQVAVDNRGNVPVTALLAGSDAAETVELELRPEAMTVLPGRAVFSRGRVRPYDRIWRGAPVTHPFTVVVGSHEGPPVNLDGTYVQEPVLPPWFLKAVAALLVLALAVVALWYLLLKPTIASAAKDAVRAPAAQASQAAADAGTKAEDAGTAAQSAQGAASAAVAAASSVGVPAPTLVAPMTTRVELSAAPGSSATDAVEVAPTQTPAVTDLVIENPQGDFGVLTISMGGVTMFQMALENFRDLDYHFVNAVTAAAGSAPQVTLECRTPGAPPGLTPAPTRCSAGVYFGGTLSTPAA